MLDIPEVLPSREDYHLLATYKPKNAFDGSFGMTAISSVFSNGSDISPRPLPPYAGVLPT